MESIKTRGLIIKGSDYGENNRIVKIFTTDLGIISAGIHGIRSKKKGLGALGRIFIWGDVMIKENGGRYTVEEFVVKEGFYPLCEDIVKLSLAAYFAEIASMLIGEYNPDERVLKLLLNTLYTMCYIDISLKTVKAVYELRLLAEVGYRPDTDECQACKSTENIIYFDVGHSGLLCESCKRSESIKVSEGAVLALRHILTVSDKRIFSFRINSQIEEEISKIAEEYTISLLDYKPKTLAYYKTMAEL